jgi:hypothetical protein
MMMRVLFPRTNELVTAIVGFVALGLQNTPHAMSN